MDRYQDINKASIDRWIEEGWEWGKPISHEVYENAKKGKWDVLLTPTRAVPHEWFGNLKGKKILGLDPLQNKKAKQYLMENDYGLQFSHTLEEQIGGQLKAGFTLVDLYEDTNGSGRLHELNIKTYIAAKAVKR